MERPVFIPISKKGNAKECSYYRTIALVSHTSKIILKILQARLQQVHEPWTPRCSSWIQKRQRNQGSNCQHPLDRWKIESSRKTSTFNLLTTPKPLTVWITTNYGKFLKRWEYQTTWPVSWEICMQVKKQQLELYMEQRTGFKLGKEYIKAVFLTLLI